MRTPRAKRGQQSLQIKADDPRTGSWKLEIVKRSDVRGFVVLPQRRIVERTLAWIGLNRRLAPDYERQIRIVAIS